jgi:hypothetical protein
MASSFTRWTPLSKGLASLQSLPPLKLIRSLERQTIQAKEAGKASMMPREEFKLEVDRYLSGKDTEASEILYFKTYKSQLSIIEQLNSWYPYSPPEALRAE